MTLERPARMGWVDEGELREIHQRQLAELFDGRHGAERAALAHAYAHLLAEFEREARGIRNVEVARMVEAGLGPTAVGRALGVQRARGDQIIRSVRDSQERDERLVVGIRRRVNSWRRGLPET